MNANVLKRASLSGAAVVAVIALLVCFQGGYYPLQACAAGVGISAVAILMAARKKGIARDCAVPILFFGFAAAYTLSAVANGVTLTTIGEACSWFGVAAIGLVGALQSKESRLWTYNALAIVGVAGSALGILIFFQIVNISGAYVNDRLYFLFQYANSAGVWFAMSAFMCLLSPVKWMRYLCILPLLASFLTFSGGTALCELVAFVILLAVGSRKGLVSKKLLLACLCGIAIALIAVCALFFPRVMDSGRNFAERYIQVLDALPAIAANPLFGIGPDNWRYDYTYFQSAQYTANVVHSSYVEAFVSGGLLAGCLLIAAVAVGLRNLIRSQKVWELVPALILSVHALIDFDLQFAALAMELVWLLSSPLGESETGKSKKLAADKEALILKITSIALSVVCLGMSFVGHSQATAKSQLESAARSNNPYLALSLYENNALCHKDPSAQTCYLKAMCAYGHPDRAAGLIDVMGINCDDQAIAAIQALYQCGKSAEAGRLMVDQLNLQPYDYGLFEACADIIKQYGIDPGSAAGYKKACLRARELSTQGHCTWITDQWPVPMWGE